MRSNVKNKSCESGFLTAEWTLALTVLLIPAFLVAFSMVQFPARKQLTQVASESAARAYVEALDQKLAPEAARTAAADVIIAQYPDANIDRSAIISTGNDSNKVKVEITSTTPYCPGSEITVRVTMPMPFLINPNGGKTIPGNISSSSTQLIDSYAELNDSDPAYDVNDDVLCP